MQSEMDLVGTVVHEHFMASWLVASAITKLLSVTHKPYIKWIFKPGKG